MSGAGDPRFGRDYFDRVYVNYRLQNPPRKLRFYRALVEPALAGRARPRILDLGCAFGNFLASLGPGWDRFGLDVSEHAISLARAAAPEVTFRVASVDAIPFDGPFDAITAFDVIEHVPHPADVLRAVASKLAPCSRFVFVVPVYDGPTGPIIRWLDKDVTHLHKEARAFWLDLAARFFQLEDWWGVYRYLLPGGYYLHVPTRALRGAAPAIAVVGSLPPGPGTGARP